MGEAHGRPDTSYQDFSRSRTSSSGCGGMGNVPKNPSPSLCYRIRLRASLSKTQGTVGKDRPRTSSYDLRLDY